MFAKIHSCIHLKLHYWVMMVVTMILLCPNVGLNFKRKYLHRRNSMERLIVYRHQYMRLLMPKQCQKMGKRSADKAFRKVR